MQDIEHQIQVAIAQYLNLRKFCWWAVPNGGRRNIGTARKLKAEGVKSGIPDINLVHKGQFYGLEVKKPKTHTPKGTLSKSQKSRISQIKASGGIVAVVYSVAGVERILEIWGIS